MEMPSFEVFREAFRDSVPKVFDWDKAAKIIVDREFTDVWAGLEEDWFWTGGRILEDGKPVMDSDTYLMSIWATPVLVVGTEDDEDEVISCWRHQVECDWDAKTVWPESALKILKERKISNVIHTQL